jgi:pimeloyl-ACP methyl ester carboxylesterase
MSADLGYGVAHEWAGAPPAQGALVLALLHAFPLDRAMWREAAVLLPRDVPVLLVDLPGLGASPLPAAGAPSLDVSADAVATVVRGAGARGLVPAGVSMGGYVALAVARRHRDLVRGIALVDTRDTADAPDGAANRERVARAVEGAAGTRALLPMLGDLLGTSTREGNPRLVDAVRAAVLAAPVAGVAWSQRAMAARPDSRHLTAGLDVPACVVVGEQDTLTPPEAARAMAARMPDAVLSVVPRAGHLAAWERPDLVAHAITALLTRVR